MDASFRRGLRRLHLLHTDPRLPAWGAPLPPPITLCGFCAGNRAGTDRDEPNHSPKNPHTTRPEAIRPGAADGRRRLRVSNGALEGMNNKVKVIAHRAYGFRKPETYITAIYHCCADLPLP